MAFRLEAIYSLKLPLIEVASDLSPLHPLHINNDGPKQDLWDNEE